MIKTRIFKFVGHIHNMQLCIEMISFINHENESILRWFSGLFSRILCPVAGCIQTDWGSDLCLPAVVLWNSAPHVSTMLRSNLDLSDSVLDMLHLNKYCQTAPTSPRVVWEGFKKNYPPSSKNKLQHIQLSDTTGTSNGIGFYGQMKLKNELFSSKHSRWIWWTQG